MFDRITLAAMLQIETKETRTEITEAIEAI